MQLSADIDGSLQIDNVVISLNGKTLINVSARIKSGEILTIMGESGSGKSTLLAYVGGFIDPVFDTCGEVFLNGQNITQTPAEHRQIGILFQDPLLFPHMSVGGNLLFAIPHDIRKPVDRKFLAVNALEEAGLSDYFEHDPATLSGGQKARVALMRVLLARPMALLLDEPFSKLDSARRDQIRKFVFKEAAARNLPVLLVTHDQSDADAAGGQVLNLD